MRPKRGRPSRGISSDAVLSKYRGRVTAMVALLGGECRACGMLDEEHVDLFGTNLELDHVDPTSKSFNPKAHWAYSWQHLSPELDKCQPLCRPCHSDKTAGQLYINRMEVM